MKKLYLITLIIPLFLFSCLSKKEDLKNLADTLLVEKDIEFLHNEYQTGGLTVEEVVKFYLRRIDLIDKNGPKLNSIIMVNPDAIEIARQLDKELKDGKIRGPLHGVPVILKDNIDTHDKMPNTAGSRALKNNYPIDDAFIVTKLRDAGAVILGKANLSEWANFRGEMSSSGWSGIGGQTKNPYDTSRTPCGSSSGSGVAVSANLTMLAVGTETNGSIVCPSQINGIVGIKPTVGLLSRDGIIPISSTQDTPGPMARTVKDAAIMLGSMTSQDPNDIATMLDHKVIKDYTQFLDENSLKGKRIGFYTAPMGRNYKVDSLVDDAIEYLQAQGAEIIEISEILPRETGQQSFQIMLYEYKDGLINYLKMMNDSLGIKNIDDLIEFNLNDPIELEFYNQKYLEMANEKGDLQSEEYLELLSKMLSNSRDNGIDKVMDENELDAIVSPTGSPAWKIDHVNGDSFQLGSSSPAAQSGYPSITVSMGNVDGLPVGISFFGRAWSEGLLISLAYSYEQGTKHRLAPKFK